MIHKPVSQLLIILCYFFFRTRFSKRSGSQLPEMERGVEATACSQEVERGTTGGGEQGALPGGPLNISERVATASQQKEVVTASQQEDPAKHVPLGAEEKVQWANKV